MLSFTAKVLPAMGASGSTSANRFSTSSRSARARNTAGSSRSATRSSCWATRSTAALRVTGGSGGEGGQQRRRRGDGAEHPALHGDHLQRGLVVADVGGAGAVGQ